LDETGRHPTAVKEVATVDDEIGFLLESRP
jgi:hypothetical protein